MALVRLAIHNLRLYKKAEIRPNRHLNVVYGDNASGKTSLLEAIHLLATGRSFRSSQITHLIRHNTQELAISGDVGDHEQNNVDRLSIHVDAGGRRQSINSEKGSRLSDLAQRLPLLVISPDSHFQFHQKSRHRRAVMDWTLFHVEQDFSSLWVRYQRAIQQRNAALKDENLWKVRFSWDPEIAEIGDKIQAMRTAELERLSTEFSVIANELLENEELFQLKLVAGWDVDSGLLESLISNRRRDEERGLTVDGPHRNDISLLISGSPVEEEASHGQNKLLLIALRLAQIQRLMSQTGKHCTLLIDDLPAELDQAHREKLSRYLSKLPVQVFVTATDPSGIDTAPWASFDRFHVEHGAVSIK